jgi:hypothetical protein
MKWSSKKHRKQKITITRMITSPMVDELYLLFTLEFEAGEQEGVLTPP